MSLSREGRKDLVYLVLAGFFVTNAILGEVIGGKLISVGDWVMSIGVIPWPVVFITTDLINEYYGKAGVRRITFVTVGLILYAFVALFCARLVPAWEGSPVSWEAFNEVFGTSNWIIVGSVIAFLVSQLLDVVVFWFFRHRTQGRLLWLRATGSTAVSQLIDTYVIMGIAFWLPGKLTFSDYISISATNYSFKLLVAVGITPVIYLAHGLIDRYLGRETAHDLFESAEFLK